MKRTSSGMTAIAVLGLAALAGCASGSTSTPAAKSASSKSVAAKAAASPAPLVSPSTCKSAVAEVISASKKSAVGHRILAIYKPKTVSDHIAAFNARKFKIPVGKNKVEILTCKGSASYDSGNTELPIGYGIQVDTNNDSFVRWG